MSLKDTELSPNVMSYVKSPIINGMRNLIYTANELHSQHGNNTMSEAIAEFLDAAKAELVICNHPEHQTAAVAEKAPKAAKKKQEIPVEPDGEDLFDSREEAIEALGLPDSKSDAGKLKAADLTRIAYGVGNEDPLLYLGMPSKEDAEGMKKKDLLSLIYGE